MSCSPHSLFRSDVSLLVDNDFGCFYYFQHVQATKLALQLSWSLLFFHISQDFFFIWQVHEKADTPTQAIKLIDYK